MSRPISILLDATRVRVGQRDAREPLVELPWDPSAPDDVVARLRELVDADACVLVVGLGFLEIAQPELPPISHSARRALLLRDADRYFPTEGAVAIALAPDATSQRAHTIALAMSSERLTQWIRAFDALAPVRAVTTVAHAAHRAHTSDTAPGDTRVRTDAAPGEHGQITVSRGALTEVRRIAGAPLAAPGARELDAALTLRAALQFIDSPRESLLGDARWTRRVEQQRQRRWVRAIALFLVSLAVLGWSAARWRATTLATLQRREAMLEVSASPALLAQRRLARAASEQSLLAQDAITTGSRGGESPADVLARLGSLLPNDAFVQRLEWDGVLWKIDGSASNAPRIVPLLDGDRHFQDVRIVAASTRFLDNGRQRESFSITFRARDGRATAAGVPANANDTATAGNK